MQMANRYMEKCFILHQENTIFLNKYDTPMRNDQNSEKLTSNVHEDVKKQELSFTVAGNTKWYSHFDIQFGSFLQN